MSYKPYSATRNSEGYLDMTAYLAVCNIERKAREDLARKHVKGKPECRVWRAPSVQSPAIC